MPTGMGQVTLKQGSNKAIFTRKQKNADIELEKVISESIKKFNDVGAVMGNAAGGTAGLLPLKLSNNLYGRRSSEEPWRRGMS
jgi:hypothetical protein